MSISKTIGISLAIIHICAFILFVLYLHFGTDDGQARLLWALWLPIDFPVSMIVPFGFKLISSASPFGLEIRTWLPYFVHGVLGPIWWYFIPRIIGYIFIKIFPKNKPHDETV